MPLVFWEICNDLRLATFSTESAMSRLSHFRDLRPPIITYKEKAPSGLVLRKPNRDADPAGSSKPIADAGYVGIITLRHVAYRRNDRYVSASRTML